MVRAMLAVGTATAVSVALALTGCAGEGDETGTGADGPAAPEATEATRTTATTGPTTTTTTSPTATTTPPAPRPATVMPGVVCRNLQEAQDTIQRAGVSLSHSEDATGQGRLQVLDSNWLVVRQTPEPGAPIGEGDAILYVVRYGEPNDCGL